MYVNEDNPDGMIKRPQFNHRKRIRTRETIHDIINKKSDKHTNNNDLLEEQIRPMKQLIINLSKKVSSMTEKLAQAETEAKLQASMNLKLHEKMDYLVEEWSRREDAGAVPELYKITGPEFPSYAAIVANHNNTTKPENTKPPTNIPKALRTLTIPTQKPSNIELITVRDSINEALKKAKAPDNAFVTHIDVNLRNNITLNTERSCKAETLRPYITQINHAINAVIRDAPSIRIHEKWAKIMVHSVSLEHFPDTPTGLELLQDEIEKFNSCKLTTPPRYLTRPETRTNKKASTVVIALPSEAASKPLLKGIDIHGKRHTTERFYTARPWDQCSNCQQYGHHHMRCKNDARCRFCAEPHKTTEHQCKEKMCREPVGKDCTHTLTRCTLCKGAHRAGDPRCETRVDILKAHNMPTGLGRNKKPQATTTAITDENSMEVEETATDE
jgi:hypothetical protein